MGELKENGSGEAVQPEQTQDGGQPKPQELEKIVLMFEQDVKTRQVNVRGAINNMAIVYGIVYPGLDAIKKHNELNNNYLKATPAPQKKGIMDFLRGNGKK
jgi:hypothetical protein